MRLNNVFDTLACHIRQNPRADVLIRFVKQYSDAQRRYPDTSTSTKSCYVQVRLQFATPAVFDQTMDRNAYSTPRPRYFHHRSDTVRTEAPASRLLSDNCTTLSKSILPIQTRP